MPLQDELSSLGSIPLFAGLTVDELSHIAGLLHRTGFQGGTNLFTVEQPGEVAYLILSGTIKIHVEQADGSDVILAILGRGELVGEMSLVENIGRSATAVTMEETAVAWIDRQAFHSCLARMPVLSTNLLGILARRLRLANEQIQSLATEDVFGRVARQLLAFAREYGVPAPNNGITIPLRLTQSDLASLVGASRVRVNQVLAHYQQRRCIALDQHQITVYDRDALAKRCI